MDRQIGRALERMWERVMCWATAPRARGLTKRRSSRGRPPGHHLIEQLESRIVLSAHLLSPVAYFGSNATGTFPSGLLIQDAAGNLYGTTTKGGDYGEGNVFEMARGSGTITTLASFNSNSGTNVAGALVLDSAGNLYGRTASGGANGYGTIFEIPKGRHAITTLASFDQPMADNGGLALDSNGNLYGATEQGGPFNDGTVFELARGSDTVRFLASFDFSNGSDPDNGVILDSVGNIYGIADLGGAYHDGDVFEIASGSDNINVLASFSAAEGVNLSGLTLDSAGNLYGTTGQGGTYDNGTAFEVVKGTGAITTLASFQTPPDHAPPAVDSAGNLYGITIGSSGDSIFKVAKGSGAVTTLASFNGTNGTNPYGVSLDSDGNLFGAAQAGGANESGTVYELPKGANSISAVASFDAATGSPYAAEVALDSAGNLYGTTTDGGVYGDGTVFEIARGSGTMTVLASFSGADGTPEMGLTLDSAANIFGTTANGGQGWGTVFEIAKGSHTITTLASFDGTNGVGPDSDLTLDSAGNLYGTTTGFNHPDMVFEVVKGSGAVKTLASISDLTLHDELALDPTGNLYGTTSTGGTNNAGIVFDVKAGSGAITTVASFDRNNGTGGGVVLDAAGNLYGTTEDSIFEIEKGTSTITPLATNFFPGPHTNDGVTTDSAGNVYSTTYSSGSNGGSIFEISPETGTGAVLAQFNDPIGFDPSAHLELDSSGNLYGVVQYGQSASEAVFKISPAAQNNTATLNGSAADDTLTLSPDADGADIDWTAGTAGGYVPISDPAGLTINATGAGNTIDLGTSAPITLHLNGTLTMTGPTGGPNPLAAATLDLSQGSAVYLDYSNGADPLAQIQAAIKAGYNNGSWTGSSTSGVITSANAAANPTQLAIGYADSADPNSPDTVPNTIELKPALIGDTNLDGTVNLADLLALTRNFGHTNASWDQGDLNYDGTVNLSDFLALARNFGKTDIVNPLLVTSTADDGSLGTLRYAIAHSNPGDTISFSPGAFAAGSSHTITLATGQLEINHNLTIAGPGAANLSISGNNASRVFQVDAGVTANLSGLTITNGNAGAGNNGGGISNSGTLDLSSVVITANAAGFGAGIYTQGVANLTNCTLSNNSASTNGGGIDTHTSATLIGCTVTNNRTAGGSGGGVLDNGGTVTLINDTITANSDAGGSGGGVANVQGGTLTISNCTIAANAASNSGGGIYLASGSATINNTVVAGDTYLNSSTPNDVSGTLAGSYNLIGDGSGGLTSANHNLLGKTSSLLDPKLGVLSNNGGPTLTMLPQTGSPLIDAGGNALVPTGTATDQRGYVRIANGTVDIGACESNSTAALAPILGPSTVVPVPSRTLAARRIR